MRNLKKVIALVAVFAMMVSTVAFGQSFTDVAEDSDYYEAIEMLSKLQILTGDDQDGDGKMDFRPNDTITRAEVAAIISRIQGVNSVSQSATEFVDVPATHWASGYIAAAAGQGIVNGYGDGNFGPDDEVLYEQSVKMLVETLGYTPYVETVGGYPVGHLTAASRYGILDGVIGGTTGAEATRGQVAQMVFNAVDTPLMDRWTYGGESEFLIYDGKTLLGSPYRSLLTDRLNVKKFEGVVTANRLNDSLTSAETDIDTDDEEVIGVAFEQNEDYANYEVVEIANGTLYAGESGIGDLIGKYVVGYAQEGNRTGEFTVLSAAASSKNKVLEINFDQFVDYYTANGIDYIDYYKNENDRTASSVRVNIEPATNIANYGIIYNGAAVTSSDIFGGTKLVKDTLWSGMITLVDNDSNSGYDVAIIEAAAPAVVDEVSTNGKVAFKNTVRGMLTERPALVFDADDPTQIVKILKDGVEVDETELDEWTVLSVYTNYAENYHKAVVLDSSVIEGSVGSKKGSGSNADPYVYTIAGTAYEVANNAYECDDLRPGDAGLFYVDAYGKLVAYDKDGNKQGSDNYGFVLAASEATDVWGEANLIVQVLDKDGSVYNKYLAEKVKFENATSVANQSVTIKNLSDSDRTALAAELSNQLITYDCVSDGSIDEITFAQNDPEENSLYLAAYGTSNYRAEDYEMRITGGKAGTINVDENTVVFFIKGNSSDDADYYLGTTEVTMSKTASKVGTIASLADELEKPVAAYDVDNNDYAGALVIFNTTGGIAGSSNIAVIDSVGTATNDDGEDVLAIEFYMNGEAQYALTDEDVVVDSITDLDKATEGSIWKFAVANGVITEAVEYAVYSGTTTGNVAADLSVMRSLDPDEEAIVFGPVATVSGTRIRVVDLIADPAAEITGDLTTINANGANVYVYDPARRSNKISVGDAADAYYDEELIDRSEVVYDKDGNVIKDNNTTKVVKTSDKTGTPIVAGGADAWGMLDYAMGYYYESDVLDVVIYRAYDFGKYSVVDAQ